MTRFTYIYVYINNYLFQSSDYARFVYQPFWKDRWFLIGFDLHRNAPRRNALVRIRKQSLMVRRWNWCSLAAGRLVFVGIYTHWGIEGCRCISKNTGIVKGLYLDIYMGNFHTYKTNEVFCLWVLHRTDNQPWGKSLTWVEQRRAVKVEQRLLGWCSQSVILLFRNTTGSLPGRCKTLWKSGHFSGTKCNTWQDEDFTHRAL